MVFILFMVKHMTGSVSLPAVCENMYPQLDSCLVLAQFAEETLTPQEFKEIENHSILAWEGKILRKFEAKDLRKSLEVLSDLILLSPQSVNGQADFFFALREAYGAQETPKKFDKVVEEEKVFRARMLLASHVLLHKGRTPGAYTLDDEKLWFSRQVKRVDVGMPHAGLGEKEDQGFLYYYLDQLKDALKNSESVEGWTGFVQQSIGANLLNMSGRLPSVWTIGGNPGGTKVKEKYRGAHGWESEQTLLPILSSSPYFNFRAVRPSALEENNAFEKLLGRYLELLALAVENQKQPKMMEKFFLQGYTEYVSPHFNEQSIDSLVRIAKAGIAETWNAEGQLDGQVSGISLGVYAALNQIPYQFSWDVETKNELSRKIEKWGNELSKDNRPGARYLHQDNFKAPPKLESKSPSYR